MTEPLRVSSTSLTGDGLTALSAVEVVTALRSGQFTAEAYAEACLARIAEVEPVVQAWEVVDRDYVLARAREADEWRRTGGPLGPLHGLPVGVKDIIDTADLPTQHGSPLFKGNQPSSDASCVARLRADGAIVMGKTVTTELARFTPGKTSNPHNREHTPGGSSSGSGQPLQAEWCRLRWVRRPAAP